MIGVRRVDIIFQLVGSEANFQVVTGGEVLKETFRIKFLPQVFVTLVIVFNRAPTVSQMFSLGCRVVNVENRNRPPTFEQHFFKHATGIIEIVKVTEHAV